MRELFLGLNLAIFDVLKLFIYMVPTFLLIVFPISTMVSVFLTILRMSSDRELIALKAGGVSIYQLMRAPVGFSILTCSLALIVSLYGISWGTENFRSLVLDVATTRAKVVIQPGVFNQNIFKGLTLFARQVDPETGVLKQVVFEDTTQTKDTNITIIAPYGEIVTDEKNGLIVFLLEDGYLYHTEGENMSVLEFTEYTINLDLSQVFSSFKLRSIKPKEMSMQALHEAVNDTNSSENLTLKAQVEVQKRFALPFACLVLGLFAIPLACLFEGVRQQVGIVFSFVFFFAYYGLFSFGIGLGEAGAVTPAIGLWSSNIVFFIGSVVGVYLAGKERTLSLRGISLKNILALKQKSSVS